MSDGVGDGGSRPWQDTVEPDLRRRVLSKILGKLVKVSEGKPGCSHDIKRVATSFEAKMFTEADSKEDYIKRIANKLLNMERNQQRVLQAASAGPSQQVPSTMSRHENQSSHMQILPITSSGLCSVQEQHMADPVASLTHANNVQTDAVPVSDQILKSSPAIVSSSSPGVHPSQIMMQPGESHTQNKLPDMQMQTITFPSGNATSVPQSQGHPLVQPNGQQNLLSQNSPGTFTLPHQQLKMHQQGPHANQQKMNNQNNQILAAKQNNVSNMHTGHPREQNSQQNAGMNVESPLQTYTHSKMETQAMDLLEQLVNVNQQSSLQSEVPQTVASTESVEEVDWREEMFQQMKTLKDAYLSQLTELDQIIFIPKITKEQFESLPKKEADQYRVNVYMKKRVRVMLNFLQFEKRNIPEHLRGQIHMFAKAIQKVLAFSRRKKDQTTEMVTGCQSQISHLKPPIINLIGDPAGSSGYTSSQQKQSEQPAAFHLRQNTAVSQENRSNILLGVGSSCVTVRSPGSVKSLPSNKLQDYRTPSPVTKESPAEVSSPYTSAKSIYSSAVAKPGAVIGASPSASSFISKPGLKVASPSASVHSTQPAPVAMSGLQATLPSAPARSTSPSTVAKTGKLNVATPPASVSTHPSPTEKVGFVQAATPCSPVISALSSMSVNSEAVLVTSPFVSIKSTSSENVETISSLLQQNNGEAAAPNGSTTNLLMPTSLLRAEAADRPAQDLHRGRAETPVAKTPINRLIDAVCSLSPAELESSANSICSFIGMDDWVPHGDFDTFEEWTFFPEQGGSSAPNKIKRIFDITASFRESPPTWEDETNLEHGAKRQRAQCPRNALLDEIEAANSMLMDIITSIADDNVRDGGTLIKLSYTAMSLAPDLKSLFASSETAVVTPMKLLVPADYPRSSPMPVTDQRREQQRNMFSGISDAVNITFRDTIRGIPEPRSISETARAWDSCVRQAVVEFAQQFGGGAFSSRYGRWERLGGA